jgi:hypothetical protein
MARAQDKFKVALQYAFGSFKKMTGLDMADEVIDELVLAARVEPLVRTRAKKAE